MYNNITSLGQTVTNTNYHSFFSVHMSKSYGICYLFSRFYYILVIRVRKCLCKYNLIRYVLGKEIINMPLLIGSICIRIIDSDNNCVIIFPMTLK